LCPAVKFSLWEYRFGRRPQQRVSFSQIVATEGGWETARR
jgi:hypothetical protein